MWGETAHFIGASIRLVFRYNASWAVSAIGEIKSVGVGRLTTRAGTFLPVNGETSLKR